MKGKVMTKYNRRSFLKASAAVAGGFVLPQFSIGQSGISANSKLNDRLREYR